MGKKKRKSTNVEPTKTVLVRQDILRGKTDSQIKRSHGVADSTIKRQRAELERMNITRKAPGVTPDQAAFVLGISGRRVRAICQEGRLGALFGPRRYLIGIDELLAFAELDRPTGTPGQFARQKEREQEAVQ